MSKSFPQYDEAGVGRARSLRRQMTPGEVRLWQRLRARQLGVAFKRQRPTGPYVVDFFGAEARLVVEVDGESHRVKGLADTERQRYLEAQELRVFRVDEGDAYHDAEGVAHRIRETVEALQPGLSTPLPGEVDPAKPGTEGVSSE